MSGNSKIILKSITKPDFDSSRLITCMSLGLSISKINNICKMSIGKYDVSAYIDITGCILKLSVGDHSFKGREFNKELFAELKQLNMNSDET